MARALGIAWMVLGESERQWAPFIGLDQVEYTVDHGVIRLKGKMDHHASMVTLVNDLEKIRGVVDVDVSQMTVAKAQQKV